MRNKRVHGDNMISDCVQDLLSEGLSIIETKNSGASSGDGDAKMSRGGLMLEGKASFTSESLKATESDFNKLLRQATEHGRIPVLVVENKLSERWAFMTFKHFARAGMKATTSIYAARNRGSSWIVDRTAVEDFQWLTNRDGRIVIACRWSHFVETVVKAWREDGKEEEDQDKERAKISRLRSGSFRSQGR